MACPLPDELRSTFYDGSNHLNSKEIKEIKLKEEDNQPISIKPTNDLPTNLSDIPIPYTKENIFVKIKRYINKKNHK